jgi:hypothetical protein
MTDQKRRIAMKRLKIIVVLSILGAMLLAMTAIGPASADKPDHWTDFSAFDFTYENCEQNGETVVIPGHLEETYSNTVFFDKDGNLTKGIFHARGTATLTYNGHILTMQDTMNDTYTWPSETETIIKITGSVWFGTLPGHGPVVGSAGNLTLRQTCSEDDCDTETIKFSGMDFTDVDAICNYMLYGE